MKIQVGKTYNSRLGKVVIVHLCSIVPWMGLKIGEYVGVHLDHTDKPYGWDIYNEAGQIKSDIFSVSHESNLKPNTVKKEGWVNIYKSTRPIGASIGDIHATKEFAASAAPRHRTDSILACVKVEWEEEDNG